MSEARDRMNSWLRRANECAMRGEDSIEITPEEYRDLRRLAAEIEEERDRALGSTGHRAPLPGELVTPYDMLCGLRVVVSDPTP